MLYTNSNLHYGSCPENEHPSAVLDITDRIFLVNIPDE
jgi:hypothetical protein